MTGLWPNCPAPFSGNRGKNMIFMRLKSGATRAVHLFRISPKQLIPPRETPEYPEYRLKCGLSGDQRKFRLALAQGPYRHCEGQGGPSPPLRE